MAESSIFAKVTSLTGEAYVRNAEGQLRQLKLGDVIREGESVVSSDNAQVVLQLADGRQLSVVPGDVVRIDAEVAAETKPDATDSAVSNDPKALTDLTQALASGQNLDELLESPAAGIPGVGNEGHTFVEFARIVESVSPLAFEYGTARGVELYPYDGGGAYTRGDGEADTRGDGGTNDGTPPPGNQTPGNLQPTTPVNYVPTVQSFSVDFIEDGGNYTVDGDVLDGSTLGNGTAAEHEFAWDNPAASSQYGAITLKPDGTYTFELDNDSAVVQALAPGQQVTETFTYTYTDVDGDLATGTLTITITGTNDVPTVNSFSHDFTEGTGNHTVNGDVLDGSTLGDGTAAEHEFAWDNPAASSQYGAITLKPDGSYTFELDTDSAVVQALTQGQQVTETFTYTYTDVDGDPATGTLTITITGTNSVPTITVDQGNVGGTNDVVYEAGLQPHGSDAGNATTTAHGSITVSAPDGLDSIESVTINSETFTVNGDLDALVNQSVSTDFGRLTITGHDGNGKLTYRYELTDPVDNDSEPDATDDSYSDIFTLTVFDGTDHSASANIVIEIVDDVPRVSQAMPMDISNSIGAVGLGALNFYDNIGADREGSEIVFQGTNGALLTSNGSNVTSGGQNIVLTGFGTDVLTGTTTGGKIVFQITLNPDAVDKANDAYTVELFQKFDDGSHISFSGNLGLKQNNIAFKLYDGGQDFDILFSGANPKSGQPTVNSNTGGFGVGNPSFEGREIIRADFVKGGSEGNTFSYTGDRYDVDSFIFSVTTANATIDVRLYDGGADNEMGATKTVGTGGQVAIAAIYIYVNGEWQVPDSNSITPDGNGGYTLSNLPMNAQIQVVGEQPFGAVEIENSGTTDTQLNLHGYSIAAEGMGNSIDLNFALQLTDGDGDTAAGSLHLTVQPAGATLGDASATHGQALVGGSGDDTLIGGAGNDTLTGGLGADTFVWHLADKSPTPGTPAVDTVTDFGNGDDKLDLRDLLQHADQNHLDQYLHFESDGSGGTILHVSTGGGFAGGAHIPGAEDQTILLQGVDLVGSNIGDQQQIITDLLAQGKLLVDHN